MHGETVKLKKKNHIKRNLYLNAESENLVKCTNIPKIGVWMGGSNVVKKEYRYFTVHSSYIFKQHNS